MLIQWNIISLIYANVMLPLTLVSNKLNVQFFSTLFQWDKNCNCFQVYFWKNYAKIVSIFWNHISHNSHKNQYPHLVCNFGFTEPKYSAQWQMLIKFCHWNAISFSLVTHTEVMLDHLIYGLVGLFGTSYHVLVQQHNKMTSSLYQCIIPHSFYKCPKASQ